LGSIIMKKIYKVALVILVILVVTIFFSKNYMNNLLENEKDPEIVLENLRTNKRGVYIFGFDECPWCQQLFPILKTVLEQHKEPFYYIDTHGEKFTKNDREILKEYIVKNTQYDDVVVPLVVMVNADGSLQYHVGTLEGHDASKDKLTLTQEEELKKKIENMIIKYKK